MKTLIRTLIIVAACFLAICSGILIAGGIDWPIIKETSESWIPPIHSARLNEWGALEFVERNLNGIEGDYGWVDVITGIVHLDLRDDAWFTAALIHEASHVQQYKDGLQYYGSHAEAMADATTRVFWDGWPQRLPREIPDNGPVGDNPVVD